MNKEVKLIHDTRGNAVVEATILFPIITMIFFALVILAMYLSSRALLQRATQYAATALATGRSDTWLEFDDSQMKYVKKQKPGNVYVLLFSSFMPDEDGGEAKKVVSEIEKETVQGNSGELTVTCEIMNWVVYKEITVTATRNIKTPIDLGFIGFPTEIPITVSSTAVVQDGDEFVRTMDIAKDTASWLNEKTHVGDKIKEIFSGVTDLLTTFSNFLRI